MNQDSDLEVATGAPVKEQDHYPLLQPMKDTVATYNNHVKDDNHLKVPDDGSETRGRAMSTGSVKVNPHTCRLLLEGMTGRW